MKKVSSFLILLLLLTTACSSQEFQNFVTVSGDRLMDGNDELRFVSFNVPTLNYQEDDMNFRQTNPYRLPDEFEMRDVFATVKEMGGEVVRIYTIPVRNENFPPESPTYVEGPGQFNEEAFKVTDMMLALAHEYQVRIIFSLLNNWQWMGGRPNYAAFRDKDPNDFWADPQLIEDFKQTVKYTITRKNSITGIEYRNDKAILCWETGNELTAPFEWTRTITRFIKSLDQNHLVLDGYYAINDHRPVLEEALTEWSIDFVSSHHYETNPYDISKNIRMNMEIIKRRKPYLIGEFGFVSTSGLKATLDTIIASPEICGALIWSLRHRNRDGGFYWHSEPMGNGIYKAYHWPGFKTGTAYDEANVMKMMREKAFEIQGKELPPVSIPVPPFLLPIEKVWSINWKGSMGATGYNVERAINTDGPWELVGYNISDADVPYFPLFQDASADPGGEYFYRVTAMNSSGSSEPSNIAGPVQVTERAIIDDMKNIGTLYHSKDIKPVTGDDRSFKEIINRLHGEKGSEIIYNVPGAFRKCLIYTFEKSGTATLSLSLSPDGKNWQEKKTEPEQFVNEEKNYDYLRPKIYTLNGPETCRFIKIKFEGICEVARVEILYAE